jgi:hypothetical protein
MCGERKAEARYYRLNPVNEEIQHLCRPCWITARRAETEWEYFMGAGKLLLYYTVIPVIVTAALVWLAVALIW